MTHRESMAHAKPESKHLLPTAEVTLLDSLAAAAMAPLIVVLARDYNAGEFEVLAITASVGIGGAAGAGFGLVFGRRFSAESLAAAGAILVSLALWLFAMGNGPWALILSRAVEGLGGVLAAIGVSVWTVQSRQQHTQGTVFGRLAIASVIGGLCGPMVAAWAATSGVRTAFVPVALVALLLAGMLVTLPMHSVDPGTGSVANPARPLAGRSYGVRDLLIVVAVATSIRATVGVGAALQLGAAGVNGRSVALLFLLGAALTIPIHLAMGRLVDSSGTKFALSLGLAASGLMLLAQPLPPGSADWLSAWLVVAIAAAAAPSLPSTLSLLRSGALRGFSPTTLSSAMNLVWAPSFVIGVVIVPWSAGTVGDAALFGTLVLLVLLLSARCAGMHYPLRGSI